MELLPI